MSENWRSTTVGELCKVKHGWAFKSEYFSNSGNHIVLTPGNFHEKGGFKHRGDKDRFYSGKYPESYLLEEGDIIVAMTEQGEGLLGSSAIVPASNKYLHNQRIGLLTDINYEIVDKFFLYTLLNTVSVRNQIRATATGAKVKHTAPERIYKCKISLPPLPTQQKIAAILSAYDDLIENNNKRIKLLEELAQITFDEWFVRMKFPNHETTPIDKATGLPVGWERKKLREVASITMGQSPKSEFYNFTGEGLPFHQGVKDYGDRFIKNTCWSTEGSRLAYSGDILFSVRAPVGRLNISRKKIILGRGLCAIRHNKDAQSFCYYMLKNKFFEEDMMGGGAIFNSVTKNDMLGIEVIQPAEELLMNYETIAGRMDAQILNLHEQNIRLKEARDLLLPRLMSGAIDVDSLTNTDITA